MRATGDALDSTAVAVIGRGQRRLRAALAAQRDRAIIFALSAIAIVLGNLSGVMYVNLHLGLIVVAIALASTLVFSYLARRSYARRRRDNFAGWWVACDVVIITAMVPWTGGATSPVWIWYLACAGMAVMHRGRAFALAGAAGTAVLYLGVLFADGSIVGFDKTLLLPLSRLVFLGCASFGLLHNTIRLRVSKQVVRRFKEEADVRATELQQANERLAAMAGLLRDQSLTDPLTGLRNRRYLTERIVDVAKRRDGRPGQEHRVDGGGLGSGFLVLDLDNLKPINDTHGHAAGDAALQHVAAVLGECTRAEDTVARLGGDEFVVFLPQVNASALPAVAQKIAAAIRTRPARLSATTEALLSLSIGYASVDPSDGFVGTEAFDNALAAADWALYRAKQEGRNGIRGGGDIGGGAPEIAPLSLPAQVN